MPPAPWLVFCLPRGPSVSPISGEEPRGVRPIAQRWHPSAILNTGTLSGSLPCPPTTCVRDKCSSPLLKSQDDDDEVCVKKGEDQEDGATPPEKHPEEVSPPWASGGAQGGSCLITQNLPVDKPHSQHCFPRTHDQKNQASGKDSNADKRENNSKGSRDSAGNR